MSDEQFYFIKFTARDLPSKTHAMICLTLPKGKNVVQNVDIIVSQAPEASIMHGSDTYRECANKIQRLTLEGHSSVSSVQSLTNSLRSSFQSESYMIEFVHYLDYNEDDKVKNLLEQCLYKVLGKASYETSCFVMLASSEELEMVSGESEVSVEQKNEEKNENASKFPPGSSLISYTLVLSPVTGTLLNELRIGDQIMVKITPNTEVANNLIQQNKLKDENGNIHPYKATITDIDKSKSPNVELTVKFTESIYGVYIEEETTIRVKMAETSALSKDEQYLKELAIQKEKSWVVPAFAVIVILLLIWIVVYFIL